MRFPRRHYRDHLTSRSRGLDNVSGRSLYLGALSREAALLIAELLNCREIVGTKRSLGEHRRKRRVTRLPHQWHCPELPPLPKGRHVLRDWPSPERVIMERKLRRVYNSWWSFRISADARFDLSQWQLSSLTILPSCIVERQHFPLKIIIYFCQSWRTMFLSGAQQLCPMLLRKVEGRSLKETASYLNIFFFISFFI